MFCALDSDMKESIAIHIAENLANNKPVDRNRLFNIKLKTNIDIEKMAEDLKSARDKLNN
jgi:hypothetical protein